MVWYIKKLYGVVSGVIYKKFLCTRVVWYIKKLYGVVSGVIYKIVVWCSRGVIYSSAI